MNYTEQVTSFYDWLELNPITPTSINLWYALMHINQKTGWADTFSVAESVLAIKTSLTGRTLRKARKELMEKGRIDFISRKGKAPIYKMIPFQEWNRPSKPTQPKEWEEKDFLCSGINSTDLNEINSEDNRSQDKNSTVCTENLTDDDQTPEKISALHSKEGSEKHSSSEKTSEVCSTLVRQQRTDKRTHATWSDLQDEWKEVFGFHVKANHAQMLGTFMDEDHMSESLILEGIERVKQATKPVLNYLWKILSNWANLGIQTIQDLVKHEKERILTSPSVRSNSKAFKGRDIPTGFHLDLTEGED